MTLPDDAPYSSNAVCFKYAPVYLYKGIIALHVSDDSLCDEPLMQIFCRYGHIGRPNAITDRVSPSLLYGALLPKPS